MDAWQHGAVSKLVAVNRISSALPGGRRTEPERVCSLHVMSLSHISVFDFTWLLQKVICTAAATRASRPFPFPSLIHLSDGRFGVPCCEVRLIRSVR